MTHINVKIYLDEQKKLKKIYFYKFLNKINEL